MRANGCGPLCGVNHIRVSRTQGRVIKHVIGIVIGIGHGFRRGVHVGGAGQPIQGIIPIVPTLAGLWARHRADLAAHIARIVQILQCGGPIAG